MKSKQELRDWFKAKRSATDKDGLKKASYEICSTTAKQVDWQQIQKIHCYQPISSLKEVDTRPLLSWLKREYPDIEITLQLKVEYPLPRNVKYDLVIVPVLGFDKRCYRLGWGGGFYDNFLTTQSSALKVGLAYEASKVDKLPHEKHDVAMDMIITEQKIYKNDSYSR